MTTSADKLQRGELFCDPKGKQWKIHRIYKKTIHLHGAGKSEGMQCRVSREELSGYQKQEIPTTLSKGQTLFCMGFQCVVAGFMKPCFVLLSGYWGADHESENAVPASQEFFASYGVRLPFPGEIEAATAERAKKEAVPKS